MKWRAASGVLCDRRIPLQLKVNMALEDFIALGSDTGGEVSELDNQTLESTEDHPDEDIPDSDSLENVEPHGIEHEQKFLQRVGLDDDLIHQSSVLLAGVELAESVTVLEGVEMVQPGCTGNGHIDLITVDHMMEQSSMTGVKRARMTSDEQPSVHVAYKSLTRASRKKLEELLQQWSEWHGQNEATSDQASSKEALEHGEETFYPALDVGLEKSAMVSFWVDKRARSDESNFVNGDMVPLYDRGFALGLTSADGSADSERVEPLEASRCFNCGSYSHSLKDCPKPRDNIAINLARKQHTSSKRNSSSASRVQTRYYESSLGKYDDLRAGVIGPELRKCLGIGELDPPPWLHRMRELGYPPGYLDVVEDEDQPSGITIYADEETKTEYEEGELPEKGEPEPPEKKMTVEFPGMNAPIPETADRRRWAVSPGFPSSSDSFKNRSQHRLTRSEINKDNLPDQKYSRDYRDNGVSSLDYAFSSPAPCHSPGYSPYDHNPVPRSPSLLRSFSDRGRASLSSEGSPGHILQSSSPYFSGHSQWSAERYSGIVIDDHRAHERRYDTSADDSSLRRDRSSHWYHQRR